jgi:cyclophilin family peptidyl-prolyl cis-trans isomerase/HEAT repeat protein
MKKIISVCFLAFVCFAASGFAQISTNILVQIVKAEDELRFDKTLENLIKSADSKIRTRAALATGRIGNDAAIPSLVELLEKDSSAEVRVMAVFAIGEIESIKGADAVLKILQETKNDDQLRARAVESAGKIAAANAKDEKSKLLGEAILDVLANEDKRGKLQNRDVILLGITAALRVRPEETDFVVAKFLTNFDARIRADAGNALARVRAKNANETFRNMLLSEDDAVARANAARALGAAEDKDALSYLIEAAVEDEDSRVRIAAIRSLGSLKDKQAAAKLLERGEKLLADYKKSKFANPNEKSELLEIATTLGRVLPNSNDGKTISFLNDLNYADSFRSSEVAIALVRAKKEAFFDKEFINNFSKLPPKVMRQSLDAFFQGMAEIPNCISPESKDSLDIEKLANYKATLLNVYELISSDQTDMVNAIPEFLRSYAKFKSGDLNNILLQNLKHKDIFVRATAAELLGEQTATKENIEALKTAFDGAFLTDKIYNDAQLAILDALFKLAKNDAVPTIFIALNSNDYLVRKKAFELLQSDGTGFSKAMIERGISQKKNQVLPYAPAFKTKLGQILNTNADYVRAVSRKNGTAKAVFTTEKGIFTIDLTPEDAPLTVDNFIKLAKSNYFNGLAIHRVVPNFVMQDGDPRGDGNGGPGWSIRCEINMLSYERGAVGMALSGKDTGGSQWFVTHSPQPHLDGGYTIFGKVNETDMKIVDNLVRGDKILSVRIVESGQALKSKLTSRPKPRR